MTTCAPSQSRSPAVSRPPTELCISILEYTPDLQTMRALVSVNRHFFEAYHEFHADVELCVLQRQYGLSLMIDGLLVLDSALLASVQTKDLYQRKQAVLDLLHQFETCSDMHSIENRHLMLRQASTEFVKLFSRLEPIVSTISSELWSRHPYSSSSIHSYERSGTISEALTLSSTETQRYYRAVCRYQTYCNLFGRLQPDDGKALVSLDYKEATDMFAWEEGEEEIYDLYFGMFTLFEVEEIACVQEFIVTFYHHLLDSINDWRDKHQPERSAFDDAQDFERHREYASERLVLLGIPVYDKLRHETLESCASLLYAIAWPVQFPLRLTLKPMDHIHNPYAWDCQTHPGRRDPSLAAEDPGFGWLVLGDLDDQFCISSPAMRHPRALLRDWGYVLWDEEKIVMILDEQGRKGDGI